MSKGPGIGWQLMKNLIFSRHLLTETTGSIWSLSSPILLAPVSTARAAFWLFPAIDAETCVGGILEIRPALV